MSLLLAIGYFVLLSAEKAPEKLKEFGKFVGGVLIAVSLIIAVSGITMLVTGTNPLVDMAKQCCPMMGGMQQKCPMMGGMQGMKCGTGGMKGGMQGMGGMMKEGKMSCPMMKGGMPAPAQQ
jgi:hypothetical protein